MGNNYGLIFFNGKYKWSSRVGLELWPLVDPAGPRSPGARPGLEPWLDWPVAVSGFIFSSQCPKVEGIGFRKMSKLTAGVRVRERGDHLRGFRYVPRGRWVKAARPLPCAGLVLSDRHCKKMMLSYLSLTRQWHVGRTLLALWSAARRLLCAVAPGAGATVCVVWECSLH